MTTKWNASQIPLLQGRIALVTGAAQGLGLECARQLALHGARVLIADFNEEQARHAVHSVREQLVSVQHQGQVEFLRVDLGCLKSVESFAEEVRAKTDRLDLLVNNAGVGVPSERTCTDGYAIQFGVNHLGHFYLTTLLFELLRKSPEARVVNVTSLAHRQDVSYLVCNSRELDFKKLPWGEGDSRWMAYEKSKLCNLLFTYELDRRLRAAGISNVKSVVAHPGITRTNIWSTLGTLLAWMLQTVEMGSLPILYAATAKDAESGQFFGPDGWGNCFGHPSRNESTADSHSDDLARQLWELSESLTKTPFKIQ